MTYHHAMHQKKRTWLALDTTTTPAAHSCCILFLLQCQQTKIDTNMNPLDSLGSGTSGIFISKMIQGNTLKFKKPIVKLLNCHQNIPASFNNHLPCNEKIPKPSPMLSSSRWLPNHEGVVPHPLWPHCH